MEVMELITQVILSWDAKTSVVLRKSLGCFRADSQSGGTLGLPKAQMIKRTSTSDHSESWAGANGRCSAHICFLCFEGFKLNVLNNVAMAQAFELSRSLIDPRVEKSRFFWFHPMKPLFSQRFELKGAASKPFTFTQANCPLQRRMG